VAGLHAAFVPKWAGIRRIDAERLLKVYLDPRITGEMQQLDPSAGSLLAE